MRSAIAPVALLPLLAAAASVCPQAGHAQAFSADYGLWRGAEGTVGPDARARSTLFNLGPVRIGPAFEASARFSGAGLSIAAGRNWFAQVGLGRTLQPSSSLSGLASGGLLSVAGGYRWNDGQYLSLQLNGGRGTDGLGLAVSYDWPRYFVRLTYDTGLNPVPRDKLRFSAGMRF